MKNETVKTETNIDGLSFTWPIKVKLFETVQVETPEGEPEKTKVITVEETIEIPRITTRVLLRYREQVRNVFGENPTSVNIDDIGIIMLDLLVPGLLDRLHPTCFDDLVNKLMEVEAETLNINPPKRAPKKKGAKKKSAKKKSAKKKRKPKNKG